MSWPQWMWIALAGISVGVGLERHGKPKTGTHSIWVDLIAIGLGLGLLYAGGFFG